VAGVPLARGFLSIAGLHPLRRAYSLTWNYGGVETTDFAHDTMATALWQTSPFRHRLETKTRRLHRRLVGDDAMLDFEVLREFRDAGMSEWLALIYGFGWRPLRRRITSSGAVSSAKLVKPRTSAQRMAAAMRPTEPRCTPRRGLANYLLTAHR